MSNKENKISLSLIWKTLENLITASVGFVIQIVLARLLFPSDYGVVAITLVFINIANVFVTSGFAAAVVQRKVVTDTELSSVHYFSVLISIILYLIIGFFSKYISEYFGISSLRLVLLIQSISLIISGINSVYNSLLTRNLDFKKSFYFKLLAVFAQGIVGITLAILNFGVWALIISNLVNQIIITFSLRVYIKWRPSFRLSFKEILPYFKYSKNILMINLINIFYNDIKMLIIGKLFSDEQLGFVSKGEQIPTLIMVNTDGAINHVMFPIFSKKQDDLDQIVQIYRKAINISIFITYPMMIGLFVLARPIVAVLLTEKWLPSTIYMQFAAILCLLWPFSLRNQALNGIGRSNTNLIIDMVFKLTTILFMLVSAKFGINAIILANMIGTFIATVAGLFVMRRYFKYKVLDQIKDVVKPIISALLMGILVYIIQISLNSSILQMVVGVISGILAYALLSILINKKEVLYYFKQVKTLFHR